jgi:hypothetical protein
MQSHYAINVSRNGRFFFCTDNKITAPDVAEEVVTELRRRLPAADGFVVTCHHWTCSGHEVIVPVPAEPEPVTGPLIARCPSCSSRCVMSPNDSLFVCAECGMEFSVAVLGGREVSNG